MSWLIKKVGSRGKSTCPPSLLTRIWPLRPNYLKERINFHKLFTELYWNVMANVYVCLRMHTCTHAHTHAHMATCTHKIIHTITLLYTVNTYHFLFRMKLWWMAPLFLIGLHYTHLYMWTCTKTQTHTHTITNHTIILRLT